jgi:hypothetical protein
LSLDSFLISASDMSFSMCMPVLSCAYSNRRSTHASSAL